jgi:hypothetical protein
MAAQFATTYTGARFDNPFLRVTPAWTTHGGDEAGGYVSADC